MRHGAVGYLILEDILENSPLLVEGCKVDAVVSVTIVQDGKDILVDDIVIDGDMLDLEDRLGNLNYRSLSNVDEDFLDQVYTGIEQIAINKAKQTPEDLWDYRFLD